ncbi:ABC transporter substrate-binding protein [Halovenus rubra]|uniref:ABC transporter substrate-binding protein n=2 Tax=Halovenus rubra TaxID=869890 RepID=A0ABD5X7I3_9EURY|nr:ABC transporter substrate-binding protein [Halovenus rubra]
MSEEQDKRATRVSRRAVLASTAIGSAGLAGCLGRLRTVRNQDIPDQLSLKVLTVPGDDDAVATQIGRMLADNLNTIGVNVDLQLFPEDELRRKVLVNQEYDLFISAYQNIERPDALRPLLHSSFVGEVGWQNPFEFTDIGIDELLEAQQQQRGSQRRRTVVDLQHEIVRKQPFIPVAVPDLIRASRTEEFTNWRWSSRDLSQSLVRVNSREADTDTLPLVSTDAQITRSLNPIAIQSRNKGQISGLFYDSLGRYIDGTVEPWAATGWDLSTTDEETTLTVTLRPELTFHDGTPLTADDVAFTVELLQDTSLGEFEVPVPAPRFRGRSSMVESVTVLDDRTVKLAFSNVNPQTAVRILTVPIFPEHVWRSKARPAEIAGVDISEAVTEALVWQNPEPIGSGPFKFESSVEDEELVVQRNDAHLLHRNPTALPKQVAERFADGIPFNRLRIQIVRSDDAALGLLTSGSVDATVSNLGPSVVPRIGREQSVELHVERSPSLYIIGCNTLKEPLGNPHFRRLIARLIDKETIREEVFGGFARPATSPLTGTEWVPSDLRWAGVDPELPFFGTNGSLDIEEIHSYLRDAGFEFSDNDNLLQQ